MDFWDSYDKPKAQKKTKPATKQVVKPVNTKQNKPETASISINISLPKLSINKKVGKFFKELITRVQVLFLFAKSKLTKKVLNISLVAVIIFSLGMIAIQAFSSKQSEVTATVDGASAQNNPDFKLVYNGG